MKKGIFTICLILISSILLMAQTTFIAVASGNWNATGVWSTDGFTPITCGPCVAGTDFPGGTDDAMTNGFTVTVSGAQNVRDFFVEDVAASVPFVGGQLTVNGVMTGWTGGQFGFPADLANNVFSGNSRIRFTAADLSNGAQGPFDFAPNYFNNEVLGSWNSNSPIVVALFNLINPGTIDTGFGLTAIRFTQLQILSNDLTTGFTIGSIEVGTVVLVNTSASFSTTVPIYGFSGVASNVGQVQINTGGTLSLAASSSYINSSSIRLIGTGSLTVGFSGANQTEGWWYQTSRPSVFILASTALITYNSTNDQNIYSTTYGDLIVTDGGASATKTLVGAGSLSVLGDVIFDGAATFIGNDNDMNIDGGLLVNGTLSSNNTSTRHLTIGGNYILNGSTSTLGQPTEVIFDGTAAQTISGSGTVGFDDITISNTSGAVSLNNTDIDVNGMLDVDLNAIFDPNSRQINLAGNLIIDGTLTASGTFEFDGSTVISGSGSASFNNVIITSTLSAPSQSASIAGDFTNNGSFSNVNGTVTFNGNNAQNISGSSTNEFYNLGITNTGDIVSNNATTNLNTEMTMSSGSNFDADGSGSSSFTIRSTSGSNTARIGDISGAIITGGVIAQRYFNGGGDVWRNFGVYINGATLADITTSGFTFNGAGNDMAYYDETATGVVANGWILKSAFGTSNLSTTLGYSMWTRATETPRVVNFNGTLNQGTQTIPLTYTANAGAADDGWHLINNPFPSTIDWNGVTRNASVNAGIAVWDTSTGTYDYSSGNIASGQAFWVQTNASGPTLSIPESAKTSGSATFLRTSEEEITDQLIVSLSRNDTIDRTYIRFMEGATDQFDTEFDGRKLSNNIFNLGSLSTDGDELAVNRLSVVNNCEKDIKLLLYDDLWDDVKKENYRGFIPGDYELSFEGLESFTQSFDFTLIDNYNGSSISTTINENSVYSFSVDTTVAESWGANRFVIQLSEKAIDENVVYNSEEHCKIGTEVTFTNTQAGLIYSIEKNGELITEDIANGNDLTLIILDEETIEGVNEFDLNLKNGSCSNVLLMNEIIFESSSIQEVSSVTDGLNCGIGGVLLKAEGSIGNAYYNWYETLDAVDPIPDQNSGEFLTPEIDATKFYYVSIINEVGCESSTRTKVIAEIVHISDPDIQMESDVISTTAVADSYQWYNDGNLMEGETTESITVKESGIYSVVITTNTCSATSENIIVEILGIKDLEEIGIEIYPNPVIDVLKVTSEKLKINSIHIYDTKGIEILRFEDVIPNEIDVKNIKKGIYIINIATDNQTITYRVRKK